MRETIARLYRIPDGIRSLYIQNAVRKNEITLPVMSVLIVLMELFNIIRVIFFSRSGLETWNNCFYFTMYCMMLFSVPALCLARYLLRQKPAEARQNLCIGIWAFWITWQVLINAYDLYKEPSSDITLFATAVLAGAVLVQMTPLLAGGMILGCYLLFTVLSWGFLDGGTKINALITAGIALLISGARYTHTITELSQQKQITEMNARLLEEQEKLRLSLEKHRIVMEQSNDIMFEWDILGDTVEFSQHWHEKFGYPLVISNFRNWLETTARLHEKDREALLQKVEEALQGKKAYLETEILLIDTEGHVGWHQIRVSLQYGMDRRPISGVGMLVDIDKQKLEILHLQSAAQKDALTGLFNKTALQEYAKQHLAAQKDGETVVMFLLDLDDFKGINDRFGHPCGDSVLSQTAQMLRRIFRDGDGIGRIGGDEFAVVVTGSFDSKQVFRKAKQILGEISSVGCPNKGVAVQCSIGAALSASPGMTYEELYQSADDALYKAKEAGKGTSCLLLEGKLLTPDTVDC